MKLAKRTKQVPISSIREIFEMASKTPGLVRLEAGQPDFDTPKYIIEEASKALSEGFIGYTSSSGIQEAKEAAANRYKLDYGIDFDPSSEIVIVGGASAAIYLALRTIINPGDEVLRPDPSWPQYTGAIIDADGVPVMYPLLPNEGFAIDFEKLEELVTDKTKAIIINTPSNPTGGILDEEQLRKVYEFAVRNDLFIISDEAYDKVIYEKEHVPMQKITDDKSRIITTCSASKTFAMCGWRVGFAAGNKEIMTQITKFQSLTTICPNYIAQKAYAAALSGSMQPTVDMKNEYKRRRDYFVNALNEIPGFKCYLPEGAFYAFVDISQHTDDDWEFTRNLIKNVKVTCIPGSSFGPRGKGFVRFSYASSIENLKEGIKRMKAAF